MTAPATVDALARAQGDAVAQALADLFFQGDAAALAGSRRDAMETIASLRKFAHAPSDEMFVAPPVADPHA